MRLPYTDRPDVRARLRPFYVPARRWGLVGLRWWAISLSILCGMLIWGADTPAGWLLLAPFGLWLRFQLNTLEEMVIDRARRARTPREQALDILGHIACDLAIYLPLAFHIGTSPAFMVAFAMLLVLAEFAGLLVFVVGGRLRRDGPMDVTRRAFWISLPAFWLGMGLPHLSGIIDAWICILVGLMTVTGINRVEFGLEELDINNREG
ncbi:MAG: hypothetical protein Alpg2KO_14200 [Alphaproteobacteria bacterium]